MGGVAHNTLTLSSSNYSCSYQYLIYFDILTSDIHTVTAVHLLPSSVTSRVRHGEPIVELV